MQIQIQLTNKPIPEHLPQPAIARLGAWVEFRGVVRGEENGEPIAALEYEAYAPMAEREIRRLLNDLAQTSPGLMVQVIHRVGTISVGETAVYVGVAAVHRAEAFTLLTEFMNRLKQDVPIWKRRARPQVSSAPAAVTSSVAASGKAASAIEVLQLLSKLCLPLATERVPLTEARGRVLREAVCAPEDQPPFDRSAVDGYAVRLDDASATFQIVDEIRAGDWKPRALERGQAVRIATGGALPADNLQVVMKEFAQVQDSTLTFSERDAERYIRRRGEDTTAGQQLLDVGAVLSAGALGLLASVGCTNPLVTRRPNTLHLATGNEIVAPEQTPTRGQIRDSNSTLVREILGQWKLVPQQRRLAEDETQLAAELQHLDPTLDLLLISGGASVGKHDFTRRQLEDAGFKIHVSKANVRPGKPLIVAQRGRTLAFGLPGNPLAHFVCLHLYVRTALAHWSAVAEKPGFQRGRLATELRADGNPRETFWPARYDWRDGAAALTPLRWSSSGDLTALAEANALLRVASGTETLPPGSALAFWPC